MQLQIQIQTQNTKTSTNTKYKYKYEPTCSLERKESHQPASSQTTTESHSSRGIRITSLSSFSADFCQIFEGLSKQWRGGNSIWINDQSGKPEFGWSSTCVSRWCLLTHGRNPAVAHLRHPPLSHLHLVCLFFRVSGPLQTPRTYSRLTRITPPTGTVRRPYSQSACSRMRETTHLESARLACLPVLDGDLAFALEFALEIPVVLVLPVDRSPEIRNWSEEGGEKALVMCYLKKALQEKQQWPP